MSHKQAKRDRKLYPHLSSKHRQEQERLRDETIEKAARLASKGKLNGACNRSACLEVPATWWNDSTKAHYCTACARAINESTHDGSIICTPVKPAPVLRPHGKSVMSSRLQMAALMAMLNIQ